MPLEIEFAKVIEPIRDLYKDEVREVAGALGLPKEIQHRMPFPGRARGEGAGGSHSGEGGGHPRGKLDRRGRDRQAVPALAVLCRAHRARTGVKGDNRIHGWIVAIRAVNSRDGMTADPLKIPFEDLARSVRGSPQRSRALPVLSMILRQNPRRRLNMNNPRSIQIDTTSRIYRIKPEKHRKAIRE